MLLLLLLADKTTYTRNIYIIKLYIYIKNTIYLILINNLIFNIFSTIV